MFKVIMACTGVPEHAGRQAAEDIQNEFVEFRRHHRNVTCVYYSGELTLTAENDFDPDGLALLDEFSDCIAAYIEPFDGSIRIVGTEVF